MPPPAAHSAALPFMPRRPATSICLAAVPPLYTPTGSSHFELLSVAARRGRPVGFASLSTSLLAQQQAQQEHQQAGRPLFSHVPLFELARCVAVLLATGRACVQPALSMPSVLPACSVVAPGGCCRGWPSAALLRPANLHPALPCPSMQCGGWACARDGAAGGQGCRRRPLHVPVRHSCWVVGQS